MPGLDVVPLPAPLRDVTWQVPGSKSITNRALILAALRDGTTVLKGVLHSDDTKHMRNALTAMGISIEQTGPTELVVKGGVSKLKKPEKEIFIGNSGTSVRFLTAFCALVPGDVTLVGDEHMSVRPIADLVGALTQIGIQVDCPTGCPPITIKGGKFPGGKVTMDGKKSSQYFSALMLSGGHATGDIEIQVEGKLVSLPYVTMTMKMVECFGGRVTHNAEKNSFIVHKIQSAVESAEKTYVIEPDASSASYPFAMAAATGSSITVPDLTRASMQGDFGFVDVLEKMGCSIEIGPDYTKVTGPTTELKGIDVDMHHISDTVMSLAAIAPLCNSPVTITNVANIRIKETDRLIATVNELKRLGQHVEYGEDWLKITPVLPLTPAKVECYSDHRIAMAFGILGLAKPGVTITDPACTAKTYPGFWEDLDRLRNQAARD
uniref:3-phosphoshikimate 1-carboxyvinyltransferase n=1 Tax=Mucochytrium quahogii TaxID=96639 RepID=A0A7S2RH55_9STRA|mmetsp:Transcript_13728/g.24389  ORF Transcript_13728/g.24389 Transcript_13728/m.24389 type:complete len:435 (-) Transcript_13728:130-1434(-)